MNFSRTTTIDTKPPSVLQWLTATKQGDLSSQGCAGWQGGGGGEPQACSSLRHSAGHPRNASRLQWKCWQEYTPLAAQPLLSLSSREGSSGKASLWVTGECACLECGGWMYVGASLLVHLPSGLTENVFLTSLSVHLAALVWEKTHAEARTIPIDLMQILNKNFRIWWSVFFFLKVG